MANDFRGNTRSDGVRRNIPQNHGSGGDHRTFADRDALKDGDTVSEPGTVTDDNGPLTFERLLHDRSLRRHAMIITVDAATGRDLDLAADSNFG